MTVSSPPSSSGSPPSQPPWSYPERGLSELPGAPIASALPQGVKRIVAIGGGRPGAGHSVLTVNLGVYLAQLGRTVVLVDADAACPALHSMLDVEMPVGEASQDPLDEEALDPIGTPVQGLTLVPQKYSHGSTSPVRPGRKPRWARSLKNLDADYILLDLGAGTHPASLELFLGADFGICVTTPDPPSVEGTYRFLRALFHRQLRRSYLRDRYRLRIIERALAELPPLPSPTDALRAIARYDSSIAEATASELGALRPYLVTNGTRSRQDVELGRAMMAMADRYLGVRADDLGHIEQDDAIWLSVVRRRPLLLDNPSSKSGRNLERIARRMVAVATARSASPPPPSSWQGETERSLYDVLWTHPGASDEELRRGYKRQRELFQGGSLPLVSLLSEAEVERERAHLEEAQKTLLDPVRRRAYDLSFFPEKTAREHPESAELTEARLLERALLQEQLAHELHGETEFTGELLRRIRESQGIELAEISQKTKISPSHLAAIEGEDFATLPAEVYTRGFVSQLAGLLGLDKTQATRTYLRRYRAYQKAHPTDRA